MVGCGCNPQLLLAPGYSWVVDGLQTERKYFTTGTFPTSILCKATADHVKRQFEW
jgi:hypothetical protein